MEDKIFDLITKMYSEFNDFRKEVNFKLDQKADKTDIVRIENQLADKTSVLFDGYMQESKFEVLVGGKKSR